MHIRISTVIAGAALALGACSSASGDRAVATDAFQSERITVEVRGEGPDIVLVPGLASDRDVWAGVADSLDERYRLHLVQVNGFAGLAARGNADGPVSSPVAEEIARYIAEVDLERPAVIGHSMGGTIAMMVAARHPESVGRVMVVDMHPSLGALFGPPNGTAEDIRVTADSFRAQILRDTAGSPTGVLEQMFPGMTRVDSMRPMLMEGVRTTNRQTAANAFHELIVTDMRPELSRITVPLTVLYVQPPEVPMPADQFDQGVREAWSAVPHARIVRFDDAAHFIMWDQPARFVAEVDTLMRAR